MGSLNQKMWDESKEFRKMTTASLVFHAFVGVLVIFVSQTSYVKLELPKPSGPINVMWAKTVKSAKKTPKYKLPGPRVAPKTAITKKVLPAKPKKVLKNGSDSKTKAVAKKKADEKARQTALEEIKRKEAMSNALAAVNSSVDDRPAPRAENFPSSVDGKDNVTAGPGGGLLGMGSGDPALGGYKERIRTIITNNFVTLQKGQNLIAEVEFKIDRAGNIQDPEIRKGSGNPSFDSAALRAVKKSNPLPPPNPNLAQIIVKQSFVIVFDPKRMGNE